MMKMKKLSMNETAIKFLKKYWKGRKYEEESLKQRTIKELSESWNMKMPFNIVLCYQGAVKVDTGLYAIPNVKGEISQNMFDTAQDNTYYTKGMRRNTRVSVAKSPKKKAPIKVADVQAPISIEVKEEDKKEVNFSTIVNDFSLADKEISFIPEKDNDYVVWGEDKTITSILKSEIFAPIYIQGETGNGKTFMVEQVCAKLKRELFRVNISPETDETDLIGGFRLVDGNTIWVNGPIVDAMTRGAVLLLDEIDLGDSKLLCLQSIIEGKGVFLKKLSRWIKPVKGFTIIATANTKGLGDETGRYIGTNLMNEAMMERFAFTVLQDYPNRTNEKKIAEKFLANRDVDVADINTSKFIDSIVDMAELNRRGFKEGMMDVVVTTRRISHILNAYRIFNNPQKSLELGLSRFPDEQITVLTEVWEQVYAGELNVEDDEKPAGCERLTEAKENTFNVFDVELIDV